MHSLDHEITIGADPSTVYRALTTLDGIQAWFTPATTGQGEPGSSWDMSFPGSSTRFEWEVEAAQPDVLVAWRCLAGPGEAMGTTVIFRLQPVAGGTALTFTHRGWPHTAGNFTRCNTLWGGLLHHLQRYAESGAAAPMYA